MSGFGEEFGEDVKVQNLDATTPAASKTCKDLGFGNHGLVIYSPEHEVLFKQKDHEVEVDEVRAKLEELIAARAH